MGLVGFVKEAREGELFVAVSFFFPFILSFYNEHIEPTPVHDKDQKLLHNTSEYNAICI